MTFELPLEQAEAVAVTLPHLLTQAVKQKTGNDKSRYVFKVDEWAIETVEDHNSLVVTLTTGNSSGVSFDFFVCGMSQYNVSKCGRTGKGHHRRATRKPTAQAKLACGRQRLISRDVSFPRRA